MEIIKSLYYDSEGQDWANGLQWLLWNFLCGLLPIWISLFGLAFLNQDIVMSVFTNNGEFALYSASFLGSCFYIIMQDFKKKSFPSRGSLSLILIPLLVLASCMFSFVALFNILQSAKLISSTIIFNRDLVRVLSVILLPVVVIISYFVVVSDNVRRVEDIGKLRDQKKQEMDSLSHDFDSLEDS